MADPFTHGFQSLHASLKRIEEHLAWIAVFQSERRPNSQLSWNALSHAKDDLRSETGWFAHQFFQTKNLLAKQPETIRKEWEKSLETLWKRFQQVSTVERSPTLSLLAQGKL